MMKEMSAEMKSVIARFTGEEIVGMFLEANTKEDQQRLAMAGTYMLQPKSRGWGSLNLSRDRQYYIYRDEEFITVGKEGGFALTLPVSRARKFVVALGQYADLDFFDFAARAECRFRMSLQIK